MARRELSVQTREVVGKKVAALRRAGVLPANVYGHGVPSVSVQVGVDEFVATLRSAARNEVIDLKVSGERASRPVVIHHLQRHPLTDRLLHADFYQVSLREKMRADVPLVIVGHSDAVSTFSGILLPGIEALHVEALPLDIPGHIEADISSLTELESAVHVRDLIVPPELTVLTDPDVVVAQVASPRVVTEEEVEAPEEETVAAGEAAEAAADEAEPEREN